MLRSACTYCQCFCCKKVGRRGRGSALVTLFNAVVSLHNCKCNVSGFYAALRLVSHSLSLSALFCSALVIWPYWSCYNLKMCVICFCLTLTQARLVFVVFLFFVLFWICFCFCYGCCVLAVVSLLCLFAVCLLRHVLAVGCLLFVFLSRFFLFFSLIVVVVSFLGLNSIWRCCCCWCCEFVRILWWRSEIALI